MANRIRIDASAVPRELLRRGGMISQALLRGSHRGAERARGLMVAKTPTDTGELRGSWKVKRGSLTGSKRTVELAVLVNSAPHAGIVERGARPHGVNRAGIQALSRWVRRHFPSSSESQQMGIVWAIVRKLKAKGQKPTHFVRNNKPEAERYLVAEIERALRAQAGKKAR